LADGWHMGTHLGALSITLFAARFARRHRRDPGFTFGTGKVPALAGFGSAVILGVTALLMAAESVHRLVVPEEIVYQTALIVAVVGLAVNLLSAAMLHGQEHGHLHGHDHAHDHHHAHHDQPGHGDHNIRAAYLHVITDALTSVLAIGALLAGWYLGWNWADPLMGIIGAVVISHWAIGLLRDTGRVLLDADVPAAVRERMRELIEGEAENHVHDLHVWRVGERSLAAEVVVVTHHPHEPEHYRELLRELSDLVHCVVEVHRCPDDRHCPHENAVSA
ncbi:MAG: CDF family Co(II)/Ni(II) efflux transporter DmeF, partial [Planctomycetota bacterium]